MSTSSAPTFRKTTTGEWVAFGPIGRIGYAGDTIRIAKRDGSTTQRTIERVGKTFQVDGVDCAYGYLAAETTGVTNRRDSRYERQQAREDAMERRENIALGLGEHYGL